MYQKSERFEQIFAQRQSNNSLKLLISKELQGQEKEESDLTPLSVGSSLQTLHYYENPGILMIVQSVDIEDAKLSLGDL